MVGKADKQEWNGQHQPPAEAGTRVATTNSTEQAPRDTTPPSGVAVSAQPPGDNRAPGRYLISDPEIEEGKDRYGVQPLFQERIQEEVAGTRPTQREGTQEVLTPLEALTPALVAGGQEFGGKEQ